MTQIKRFLGKCCSVVVVGFLSYINSSVLCLFSFILDRKYYKLIIQWHFNSPWVIGTVVSLTALSHQAHVRFKSPTVTDVQGFGLNLFTLHPFYYNYRLLWFLVLPMSCLHCCWKVWTESLPPTVRPVWPCCTDSMWDTSVCSSSCHLPAGGHPLQIQHQGAVSVTPHVAPSILMTR